MTSWPDMHVPTSDDGLLAAVTETEAVALFEAAGLTGSPRDAIARAAAMAAAGNPAVLPLAARGLVRWPAVLRDGTLCPPPASHQLEALVHQRLLDDVPGHIVDMQTAWRPEAGTVALLDERELCDRRLERPAVADMALTEQLVWGYHCVPCLSQWPRTPLLGTGRGQWLICEDELAPDVLDAFVRARRHWRTLGEEHAA